MYSYDARFIQAHEVVRRYLQAVKKVLRQITPEADKQPRVPYSDPKKELFFNYERGTLLFRDTDRGGNRAFDAEALRAGVQPWPLLGKLVYGTKTIVFLAEFVGDTERAPSVGDASHLHKLLTALMKADPLVTPEWKLKGLSSTWGKTIKAVLAQDDQLGSASLQTRKQLYGYHGTSASRAVYIMKFGLQPGQFSEVYNDLIPGYSEKMVYLASDIRDAVFYAKRQQKMQYDFGYAVLKVRIPDNNKLFAGDTGQAIDPVTAWAASPESTLKVYREVAYLGRIPASHLEVVSSSPKWAEIVQHAGEPAKTPLKTRGVTDLLLRIEWHLEAGEVKIGVAGEGSIIGRKIRNFSTGFGGPGPTWSGPMDRYLRDQLLDDLHRASLFDVSFLGKELEPLFRELRAKGLFVGDEGRLYGYLKDGVPSVQSRWKASA